MIQRALIFKEKNIVDAQAITLEECHAFAKTENTELNTKLKHEAFSAILLTLKETQGSKKEAARILGISDRTLRYKLAEMKAKGILKG